MAKRSRALASPFTTETVWNAGLAGTGAVGNDGRSLVVGHDGEWAPEHLLLLAAESCFMSTLLALAEDAGIEVLGYVSNGRLQVPEDPRDPLAVSLAPCVVVTTDSDAVGILRLAGRARTESTIARALGDQLTVALDVRSVPANSAS